MNAADLKKLSVQEFTRAAERYEGNQAGIYSMCREDYPDILAELERESFADLLDAGCGPAPMLALLSKRWPERHYVGIDLTPKMIETARRKRLPNTDFVVGDCEQLPFLTASFDVVICSQSFHHYPNPQAFFQSVHRVLRPGGKLVLRDMTASDGLVWLINHVEVPLCHLVGHGDVRCYTVRQVRTFCEDAGLTVERVERRPHFRLHCVARKG